MKPTFRLTVLKDSSTISLEDVSDNVNKDGFDGRNLKIDVDMEQGEKLWFVVKVSDNKKQIENIKEVINYVTIPEDERTTKITYIHKGMALVQFEMPEDLGGRVGLDIEVRNMETGKYYFNTQYLNRCYTTFRSTQTDITEIDLEVYPYPDLELNEASYEYKYLDRNIPIKDNKAILKNFVIDDDIFLKGKASEPKPKPIYEVKTKYEGFDFTPKEIVEGVPTSIKIIKNNEDDVIDYFNSKCSYKTDMGFTTSKKLNKNNDTFENIESYGDVSLIVYVETKEPPIETVDLKFELEHCKTTFTGEMVKGEETEFEFIADDGYSFVSRGKIIRDGITTTFTPTDLKKFTITFTANTSLVIELKASKDVEVENKVINTFKLTDEQMYELAKVKIISIGQYMEVDYSPFVLKSFTFPLKLDDGIMGKDRNIILGNYDTKVVATPFNVNMVDYNLGKVEVPEKYGNLYDYKDVEIRVNLPFGESVNLLPQYVIGQTVEVVYTVDYYTGVTTVNIYSTYTTKPIHTGTINMIRPIPLFNNVDGITGHLGDRLVNKLKNYSIEVVRNIPYFIESEFGGEVICYDKLNKFDGFIKVDDIILDSSATTSEKEKIISLLKNGVKIVK